MFHLSSSSKNFVSQFWAFIILVIPSLGEITFKGVSDTLRDIYWFITPIFTGLLIFGYLAGIEFKGSLGRLFNNAKIFLGVARITEMTEDDYTAKKLEFVQNISENVVTISEYVVAKPLKEVVKTRKILERSNDNIMKAILNNKKVMTALISQIVATGYFAIELRSSMPEMSISETALVVGLAVVMNILVALGIIGEGVKYGKALEIYVMLKKKFKQEDKIEQNKKKEEAEEAKKAAKLQKEAEKMKKIIEKQEAAKAKEKEILELLANMGYKIDATKPVAEPRTIKDIKID